MLNRFSLRACILLLVINLTLFSVYRFWVSENKVIEWDITLYYSYLPALFIYEDLQFKNVPEEFSQRQFYLNTDAEGNHYVKMTSGLAMLYSPFFLLAHAAAQLLPAYPTNGFSLPYRFMILLSAIFYNFLGLLCLRKVLLRFFTDKTTAWSLIILHLGTNMLYYTLREPMSHVYNFFLFSALLYLYFSFLEQRSWGKAILIGLISGLIVLIRPTNLLMLLLPFIHLFLSRPPVIVKGYLPYMAVVAVFAFIAVSPQLFYWHYATGNWIIYSYNDERFFFDSPEIINGLFSYRKGWLIYSPVVIFGLIGLVFLFWENRALFWGSVITLFLSVWVVFSWWCWWYGGGFGARPLIDYLPIVAIGMATTLKWLGKTPRIIRSPAYLVMICLVFFSIFYTKQYKSAIIHYDSMSKELFWAQFMIDHFVPGYADMLDEPDYDAAKKGQ